MCDQPGQKVFISAYKEQTACHTSIAVSWAESVSQSFALMSTGLVDCSRLLTKCDVYYKHVLDNPNKIENGMNCHPIKCLSRNVV